MHIQVSSYNCELPQNPDFQENPYATVDSESARSHHHSPFSVFWASDCRNRKTSSDSFSQEKTTARQQNPVDLGVVVN